MPRGMCLAVERALASAACPEEAKDEAEEPPPGVQPLIAPCLQNSVLVRRRSAKSATTGSGVTSGAAAAAAAAAAALEVLRFYRSGVSVAGPNDRSRACQVRLEQIHFDMYAIAIACMVCSRG